MAKKPKKKKEEKPAQKTALPKPYPWWAKLLVCLSVLTFGGLAIFFSLTVYSAVTMVRQAQDPVFIATALKSICKIDTLPPGFKYQLAASVFGANMVYLVHEPDGSGFMLGVLPPTEKRDENARVLADSMADQGIPSVARELKILDKGAIDVAGEKLEYVLGEAPDQSGNQIGGFIGCAILKDRRALLVYGVTPGKKNREKPAQENGVKLSSETEHSVFNMAVAKELFSSIKSF